MSSILEDLSSSSVFNVCASLAQILTAAVVSAILLCQVAFAQEAEPEVSKEAESTEEEVVVLGRRRLQSMRVEILQAQEYVFTIYNALNDEDDYDIHCRMRKHVGTHIQKRVCSSRIIDNARAEAEQSISRAQANVNLEVTIRRFEKIVKQRMREMVNEDEQLYEAMKKYYLLRTEFEAAGGARFEERFITW